MIPVLSDDPEKFPDPSVALTSPNGLLAIGGCLSPKRLLAAYRQGIFPWYEKEPILWWSPDPRAVLFLKDLHISKTMRKILRKQDYHITMDEKFEQVIKHCAAIRRQDPGTWINPQMQSAYLELNQLGLAHSLEVSMGGKLVGGIYGISLGRMFFGESMFSLVPNASKIALTYLVRQLEIWHFDLIDCQVWSEHLAGLGATTLPRETFLKRLATNNKFESKIGKWVFIE